MRASDYLDTPGTELPVLASKRAVLTALPGMVFVEPDGTIFCEWALAGTERQVRESLKGIPVPK